ncbi:Cue5p [Sugiyamaella lignohabitans]|uniref:Cue5p n=1 Tax=Sugiyamaella lignohabitans TaxID=796027 RepID=A0A167CLD9_9ASCO|nr:Cue5p [Sugiyamaella lignohabitans]ANB11849.1 Cue5p [Sugiyamaella lignohabitans]
MAPKSAKGDKKSQSAAAETDKTAAEETVKSKSAELTAESDTKSKDESTESKDTDADVAGSGGSDSNANAKSDADISSATAATTTTATSTTGATEGDGEGEDGKPPAKPARPMSPHAEAQATLEEAFPGVEKSVIRAVLIASQYKLDPAFNALLAMNDPDFKPEDSFPVETDEPSAARPRGPDPKQLAEDEALARKLAAEYNRSAGSRQPPPPPLRRTSTANSGDYNSSSRVRQSTSSYSGRYDEPRPVENERSFFDDDLPEIKATFEKGFNETKTKVSNWMNNFRKKIDGEGGQPGIFGALGGTGNSPRSSYDNQYSYRRTSNDEYDNRQPPPRPARYNNGNRRVYDRDPDEINDDFQGVTLQDDVDEAAPPKPPRPSGESGRTGSANSTTATTTVKKTTTSTSTGTKGASEDSSKPPTTRPRAVSALGDDDPEEITKSFAPPPLSAAKLSSGTSGATAKWEPLKAVAPEPESDKDAFFIGDSDEDDDDDEPLATLKK